MKPAALLGSLVLSLLLPVTLASAALVYSVEDRGTGYQGIFRLADDGAVIATQGSPYGDLDILRVHAAGVADVLGTLHGSIEQPQSVNVAAANQSGSVAGYIRTSPIYPPMPGEGQWMPFLWSSTGGLKQLGFFFNGAPIIYQGSAQGISDTGLCVGHTALGYPSVLGPYKATFWTSGGNLLQIAGDESEAVAVNDSGLVVGTDPAIGAFLWDTISGLRTMGSGQGVPKAINNSGVVVGSIPKDGSSGYEGFVWDSAGGLQRITFPAGLAPASYGWALNEQSLVASTASLGSSIYHAIRWTESAGVQDLNDLVSAPGLLLRRTVDVNERGQILVEARDSSDHSRMLVLHLLGDTNLDAKVNALDISSFVDALTSGGTDVNWEADTNQDGYVNALDISRFVELLTGGEAAVVPEPSCLGIVGGCLGVAMSRRWR